MGSVKTAGTARYITLLDENGDIVSPIYPLDVRIGDGTNLVDVISYEGETSLRVVTSHKSVFTVHLNANNISSTQGFMLVSLSDIINWPHTGTDHIVLEQIFVNVNPSLSPAFVGDIDFGFLSNVDATNGDLHQIGTLHGERANPIQGGNFDFSSYGLDLEVSEFFGPIDVNDTTWQTDVNLQGPDGATSYPSADGDLVVKINMSAGVIDLAVTLNYVTKA